MPFTPVPTSFTGTISNSTITASEIDASTFTGGLFQTSTGGQRIVIDGATDRIDIYDATGTLVGTIIGVAGELGISTPAGADMNLGTDLELNCDVALIGPPAHNLFVSGNVEVDGSLVDASGRVFFNGAAGKTNITGSGTITYNLGQTPRAFIATIQSGAFRVVTVGTPGTNSCTVTVWDPATGLADTSPRTVDWVAVL